MPEHAHDPTACGQCAYLSDLAFNAGKRAAKKPPERHADTLVERIHDVLTVQGCHHPRFGLAECERVALAVG